ncbi:hypothetical protein [Spiroplasma endosymbiont of Aspidapion aeneum]|uniref:hypothetical protein n=1 Tax=Spiroplasma endosymbiont of Aspidapion aeneum TaxID=3066276 RepID=UPI00313E1DA5
MKKISIFILFSFLPFISALVTSCGVNGVYIKNPCDDYSVYYVKKSELVNNQMTISQYWVDQSGWNEQSYTTYERAYVYLNDGTKPIFVWERKIKPPSILLVSKNPIPIKIVNDSDKDFINKVNKDIDKTSYICYWFSLNILFDNVSKLTNQSNISIQITDNNNKTFEKGFKLNYSKFNS